MMGGRWGCGECLMVYYWFTIVTLGYHGAESVVYHCGCSNIGRWMAIRKKRQRKQRNAWSVLKSIVRQLVIDRKFNIKVDRVKRFCSIELQHNIELGLGHSPQLLSRVRCARRIRIEIECLRTLWMWRNGGRVRVPLLRVGALDLDWTWTRVKGVVGYNLVFRILFIAKPGWSFTYLQRRRPSYYYCCCPDCPTIHHRCYCCSGC